MTLVPRQFTIFVVIIEDFPPPELALELLDNDGGFFTGCAEVMLIVNDGQRSAREAIVIAPRDESMSISGLELQLLLLLLLLPLRLLPLLLLIV